MTARLVVKPDAFMASCINLSSITMFVRMCIF